MGSSLIVRGELRYEQLMFKSQTTFAKKRAIPLLLKHFQTVKPGMQQ
jgi:hypothetical protein